MVYLTVRGIVVKTMDYNEADKILTILSFEKGRMSIIARGVRKQGSQLSFCTRLFYCGIFECVVSREKNILTGSRMMQDFSSLSESLERLYCASHYVEVAACVILEDQPSEEQMKLLLNTLYMLSTGRSDLRLLSSIFELRLLAQEGFCPCIGACVRCGSSPANGVRFSSNDGGLVCCEEGLPVSAPTLKAMEHILGADPGRLFSVKASAKVISELFAISRTYTDVILDKSFKKLDILSSEMQ
ncbi:MAG: DNA repair protein RecO [Clostridia bacterium]